jgi:alpha/beta superfamily hydrolase
MKKVQERMVVFPSSGGAMLEGLYHKGEKGDLPGMVIAAPHPRMGGSMDSPVVAEIAFASARDQRPTMRFNYRGVGASRGELAGRDASEEVEDFRAALEELRATTGSRLMVAAGYSFGARVALSAALSDVDVIAAILVSPPTSLFAFDDLAALRMPALILTGSDDEHVDRARLSPIAAQAGAARIEVIAGANHVFSEGLVPLNRAINTFLASL